MEIYNNKDFLIWKEKWERRLKLNNTSQEKYFKLMLSVNPLVIPRNHKVEEVLEAAEKNNFKPITRLVEILKDPYSQQKNIINYQIPSNSEKKYQTFCGT